MTKYEIIMVTFKANEWRCICPDVPITHVKGGEYTKVLGEAKEKIQEFAQARLTIGLRLPKPTEVSPQIIQIYTHGSSNYKLEPYEVSSV